MRRGVTPSGVESIETGERGLQPFVRRYAAQAHVLRIRHVPDSPFTRTRLARPLLDGALTGPAGFG